MQKLIDEFNRFFEGDAKAEIENERLKITIGTRRLVISLPSIIGGEAWSTDSSRES